MPPQTHTNRQIFLSYCWANIGIADAIDREISGLGLGVTIIRDVRNLGYRNSIKEFMLRIGESDYVLMLISDEYLRSGNCMYEVIELLNSHAFEKKILPVLIGDGPDIYKIHIRELYFEHWETRLSEAQQRIGRNINEDFLAELRICQNINNSLGLFFVKLIDLKILSYGALKEQAYTPLLEAIGFDKQDLAKKLYAIAHSENEEEQEVMLDDLLLEYPSNAYIYYWRGRIVHDRQLFWKARSNFGKAVRLDGTHFEYFVSLGSVLSNNFDQHEEAKRLFERAVELNPKAVQAYLNLIVVHKKLGDIDRAIGYIRKIIEIDPQSATGYEQLADILMHDKGNEFYEEARKAYETAVSLALPDPLTHGNYGLLLYYCKDYDNAYQQIKKSIDLGNTGAAYYYHLGIIQAQHLGDAQSAVRNMLKAIELKPAYYKVYVDLGIVFRRHLAEYQRAKYYFEQAITLDPSHPDAYNELAILLADHLDDWEGAKQNFEKALIHRPENSEALFNLGIYYSTKFGDKVTAVQYFEKVVAGGKDANYVAKAHINLGVHKADSNPAAALDHYLAALAHDPLSRSANANLAILYRELSEWEKASEHFKKAIEADDSDAALYSDLGAILCDRLGKHEEARLNFEKALAIEPEDAQINFNMGIALSNLSRDGEAVGYFEKTAALAPGLSQPHFQLFKIYNGVVPDAGKAAMHLERFCELSPGDASAHVDLAELYRDKLNDPMKAVAHYKQGLAIDPKQYRVYLAMGFLLVDKLADYEEARACIDTHHELQPDNPNGYQYLGAVQLEREKWREARSCLRIAVAIDPTRPNNHFNLGLAAHHLGDHKEAVSAYENCLQRNPKHLNALYNLALIFQMQYQDGVRARPLYEKVLEIDADQAEAHVNLGVILARLYQDRSGAIFHYKEALRINPNLQQAKDNLDKYQ